MAAYIIELENEVAGLRAHSEALEARLAWSATSAAERLQSRVRAPEGFLGPVGNSGQPILTHEQTYAMMRELWPVPPRLKGGRSKHPSPPSE